MTFSIRDLLLLTVIVALAVGWWVDRQEILMLRNELEKASKENGSMRVFLTTRNVEVVTTKNGSLRFRGYHRDDD